MIAPTPAILTHQRGAAHRRKTRAANFRGAKDTRHTADWKTEDGPSDKVIVRDLDKLRNRARDLERDEAYVENALQSVETNIVGDQGFTFSSRAETKRGKPDVDLATAIDKAWADFSKKGNYDVTRSHDRASFERLLARSLFRDGEMFARMVDGFPKNDSRFAVQGFESEAVDHRYRDPEKNIFMGIEFDAWDGVEAYHINKRSRHDWLKVLRPDPANMERVGAADMLHIFYPKRFSQTRGYSWLAPTIGTFRHLGKFSEATLVAARLQANNPVYFETDFGSEYRPGGGSNPNDMEFGEDEAGEVEGIRVVSEPGGGEELPPGVKAHMPNPTQPNDTFAPYVQAQLQHAAAGIITCYPDLAQNYRDVNYSSARIASLSEREKWKLLQGFMICVYELPVFERWLRMALLLGQIPGATLADFERCRHVEIQGRRWPWVDPEKDAKAAERKLAMRLVAPSTVGREMGYNFEKENTQAALDEEFLTNAQLEFDFTNGKSANAKPQANDGGNEPE